MLGYGLKTSRSWGMTAWPVSDCPALAGSAPFVVPSARLTA